MTRFLIFALLVFSSTAHAYELEECIDYCVYSVEDNRHLKQCIEQCEVEFPTFNSDKNFCETYEDCDDERDPWPLF